MAFNQNPISNLFQDELFLELLGLTEREILMLKCLTKGKSDAEVSKAFRVSEDEFLKEKKKLFSSFSNRIRRFSKEHLALKKFYEKHGSEIDPQQRLLFDDEEIKLLYRIENLDISPRTINTLKANGIFTIGNLINFSHYRLLSLRNFGPISLYEIEEALNRKSVKWKNKEAHKTLEKRKKKGRRESAN